MITKQRLLILFTLLLSIITISFMYPDTKGPALHYVVRQPQNTTPHPPLLLLLHGVGSNEQNMFSLAPQLPDKYLVVSARGPLTLGTNSYGWFHVDFSTGRPVINKEEAEQSRLALIRFIGDLHQVLDFDEKQVYLAGFSQGGIMSYSVALTAPEKVAGIAVMSGRLLPEIKPLVAPAAKLSNLKVFVSHGTTDPVLPFQYALDAKDYLHTLGLQPNFNQYTEGHTINANMLADMVQWLP